MSGKLDQSLDEIMKDRKPAAAGHRRPARKAATKAKTATAAAVAPAGGIKKKGANKTATHPNKARAATSGGSKIAISGLPRDADEPMIKEYFEKTIGQVKEVICTYGPDGRFRGMATVRFAKPTAAAESAKYDGTLIDGKPWRIEVVMDAQNVAKPPAPKSLQDRISNPKKATKDKPKSVTKAGASSEASGTTKKGRARNKTSGRAGKPKAKTADELDAEMTDYFGGGQTNGTTTTAAGGDTMDDVE